MKKTEHNDLLVEIIRQKVPLNLNELKEKCLYLESENITPAELAEILDKPTSEIIAYFWDRGENISKNQSISSDLLERYCRSIKITVKRKNGVDFGEIIQEYLTKIDKKPQLVPRSPIVSIMGHIDHGKTTLLDTIRQTKVQSNEVGGITQKITACSVEFQGKKILFLDTPGHNDFIKMRQRGISLTDIVVLVIDASDGIMSQTAEIIDYLSTFKIPVIVFINHKKPHETNNKTNLNRLNTQLQEKGLTPLEWGGETIVISGNAQETKSTNYLLENILLVADTKTNSRHPGNGIVIDSYHHSRTNSRITELLVLGGKVKQKDNLFLNGNFGEVKMMYDLDDKKVISASAGELIRVIGLTFITELGDRFLVINNEITKELIEERLANYLEKKIKLVAPPLNKTKQNINLVLVANSQNTLEALRQLVSKQKSATYSFSVVYTTVRNLNDFALGLAKVTQSTVLSFGMQFSSEQTKILKGDNIPFFVSKIIYEVEDELIRIINSQQIAEEVEEITGKARVEKSFYFSKVGNIAGCQVISGKISRNNQVHIFRKKGEIKIFTGGIKSLESNNEKKIEVISGHECGIVLNGFDDFQKGDEIIAFKIVKKKC